MTRFQSPRELEARRAQCLRQEDPGKTCLTICAGSGCTASGALDVIASLEKNLREHNLDGKVNFKSTGCHGFCEKGPVMIIWPEGIFYNRVTASDARKIVSSVTNGREPVKNLLYHDPSTGESVLHEEDVPFYRRQKRILFGKNGRIDPKSIDDYLRVGGYAGLARALSELTPAEVTEEILRSGLRGRGGAGFPTGRKWQLLRQQRDTTRYIICNADEGDPGAFMDRSLLEGNPHSIIEGMAIGAYALGAREGFVYVRAEYPLAVEHLKIAIAQAEENGLVGEKVFGTSHSFHLKVIQGAGAFVCGEETALIASIEGRVGEPVPRPPFPAQKGLWGKPTIINNVKTWASVPVIITRGANWYASIGTESSKGTMVFSLVGKVNNTGLVEVPMGITLREMIYEIGGGIPDGKKLKAVQVGGPSGGCIPASMIDLPIDYEALTRAGSMMGSGGMVVLDEDTCMVDLARYFMEFLEEESCGKCFPCREGTQWFRGILARISEGKGTEEDLTVLEDMGWMVKETSLCGLGQTAPNPILTTLRYFREEYLAHIREKRCPAKVCKELITYSIEPTLCDGCHACVRVCTTDAILGEKKEIHDIDDGKCIRCGACLEVCRPNAVLVY